MLQNGLGNVPSYSVFFGGEFKKDWHYFNTWWNLPGKSSDPDIFFVGKFCFFFITNCLLTWYRSIQSFSFSLLVVGVYLGICPFHLRYSSFWHIVVHSVISYNPLNPYKVGSNVPSAFCNFNLLALSLSVSPPPYNQSS